MDESVVREFEQQQVGKLKLSQAIRIGAKMRPKSKCALFDGVGSCALGAAYEAVTGRTTASYDSIASVFPEAALSNAKLTKLGWHITYLSDTQSREAAADWLESQGL